MIKFSSGYERFSSFQNTKQDAQDGMANASETEKSLYHEFSDQIAFGAEFEDFVGFWALGMHLLQANELELYVFRSCNCSMKAWFIKDLNKKQQLPKWNDELVEFGTDLCAKSEEGIGAESHFIHLDNYLVTGQAVRLEAQFNNTKCELNVNLVHFWKEKEWGEYIEAIIREELNMSRDPGVATPEEWQKYDNGHLLNITILLCERKFVLESSDRNASWVFDSESLLSKSQFTLEIVQQNYTIWIILNGETIGTGYWLFNWWRKIRTDEMPTDEKSCYLRGNALKLDGMKVLNVGMRSASSNAEEQQKITTPYIYELPAELKGGETILIRGFILRDRIHSKILMLYNTNVEPRHIGDFFFGEIVMVLKIYYQYKYTRIEILQNNANYIPESEVAIFERSALSMGELFELRIIVPNRQFNDDETDDAKEFYNFSLNLDKQGKEFGVFKHVSPLWKIQRILFQDMILFHAPIISFAGNSEKEMERTTDYSISIIHLKYDDGSFGGLLKPGDRILMSAQIPEHPKDFIINFCSKQDNCVFKSPLEVGHIVLHVNFRYEPDGEDEHKIIVSSWIRDKNWDERSVDNPFKAGPNSLQFQIDILPYNGFNITIADHDQENDAKVELEYIRDEDKGNLPPWAADHIQIYGDVNIPQSSIHRQKWRENSLEMPYVNCFENGLELNKMITIRGQLLDNKEEEDDKRIISIGLYHNGLNFLDLSDGRYDPVSETVLQIDFFKKSANTDESEHQRIYSAEAYAFYKIGKNDASAKHGSKQMEFQLNGTNIIEVQIRALPEHFDIRVYNDQNNLLDSVMFNRTLPLWAAEYLHINGNFMLEDVQYENV